MSDINGYQIFTQIYESSNSIVYRGIRKQDNKAVILKMLKQDYPTLAELTRYKQEYAIVSNLNLEGVVKAYSLEEYQRTLVIIFEDFGGNSLKMMMNNPVGTPCVMSLQNFLPIAIQTTEILGQIHAANVIHKDINSANIVFNSEIRQVKIIDFGIATILTREHPVIKNPNILEGTLAYISPEQTGRMNRCLDYRTDFYSLGVTFYELLTGQLPFVTTDALELVHCHIAKQPIAPHTINSEIPKVLSNIVMRLLAKTAEERYQSAFGIKADLQECFNQLQRGEIEEFALGTQDISDKFQIPQKLYGREKEIETLLSTFERVAGGEDAGTRGCGDTERKQSKIKNTQSKIEMILVAGYSGIGKSALVQEVYKPITRSRGYFISGKFDQFQRNIPYSAVVNALGGLLKQLLTESEAQIEQWRGKLLTALGVNGQIIIDVIPEVELIIGKQPNVPELGATEAQNRFNLVFQNFIRTFCAAEHPLVIFLDDLQRADSATLKLIELMMIDTTINYLFLIGAYRDNEVSPTHPLITTLEELRHSGATIHQITLAPLALNHINQLIAETLHSSTEVVNPLAELVVSKTNGNPFFVNEFLKTLYQENLITFNFNSHCWQWEINQIEAMDITDNVVELMIGKLKKLPSSTQNVLRLAACVGAEFDITTLSTICEQPAAEISSNLQCAIQSGLILSQFELDAQLLIQEYKFGHDRIQQAAYALIDEAHKKAVHLQIGRLLLQNTEPEAIAEKIFEIVDHFSLGIEHVTEPQERFQIAELNLKAGQKAKAAIAYRAAVKYLNIGLTLLAEESWETQYELTLDLYEEIIEAEYINTNYEGAEKLAEIILDKAKNTLDRVKAYELKIQLYTAQNNPLKAVETGLQALELLEITLSTSNNNALELPVLTDLDNVPEMTDVAQLAAMRILMSICPAAYFAKPEVLLSIALTMVNLTIQHGYSALAAYGYVWYAAIYSAKGDIDTGYHAGQLALKLVDKYHARELKAKVNNLYCALVRHWKEPARNSIATLQDGIQSGLDTGDNEYTSYCIKDYCVHLFLTGEPLESVELKMAQSCELLLKLKQEYSTYQTNIWRQVGLILLGQSTTRSHLLGDHFNEEEMIPRLVAANNRTLLCIVYLAKLNLSYLFKEYDQAVTFAIAAADYLEAVMGFMYVAIHNFYYSLALLAQSSPDRSESLRQVELNQTQMQQWVSHAPSNFQHKYELVEAEKARVLGQEWQAAEFYEQAIKHAGDNGYIQEEALACELAAEFYLARGMDRIAQTYMKEAHYGYTRWQAWAKVEELETRYPQLLPKSPATIGLTSPHRTTISTSSSTESGTALDFATVMKASQAVSGEIMLDKLLATLMKILIENVGAQIGYLILETEGQWSIEASSGVDCDTITVLQSIPLENRLPVSVINYVARTKETVVKHDATHVGKFTNDPYIKAHQTKSILCSPLLNQGQLSGIVYLENNLTTGAFTPDRLEILQLLSGQAAIAITNAKLYAEVTESERRLTQFLEAMPVGVSVHVPTGQLYYANQAAQQLMGVGISPDAEMEQLSEAYSVYRAGTNELYPSNELPLIRSLCGERASADDLELHHPDKIVPVEIFTTPIFDETGKIEYAIAAFQDISDRKQAEKVLAEYNRTLELQVAERTQELKTTLDHLKATQDELIQSEKMAALGQLVAGVAHEINTPLGAIRSSAGNISKFLIQTLEELPKLFQSLSLEQGQDFLALVQRSLQHESTLSAKQERQLKRALIRQLEAEDIEDADPIADTLVDMGIYSDIDDFLPLLQRPDSLHLLDVAYKLSGLQRGTQTINTATERASKVVFALKTYARYDHLGELIPANPIEGIETVLTLYHNLLKQGVEVIRNYTELPPVLCYPDELNQVWTNLIHNAVQAMDNKGTLVVDVMTQDQWAKISITDSGSGIPPEIMPKIFEPFFTTKPSGEGSGLGLDIVKKIIDKHQGQIEVESIPGKTTFTVYLPITLKREFPAVDTGIDEAGQRIDV
ncbi:MAG TPA: AAA family ATPase [Coleofasciculaceae cyanobacterium]